MNRRYINLALILIVMVVAIFVDAGGTIPLVNKSFPTKQGLDLQGGIQALLEVALPADTPVTLQQMTDTRQTIENRINGLGVGDATVQIAGDRRMVVEIPGESNPQQVFNTLKSTGQLEFVDMGDTPLAAGTVIQTNLSAGTATTTTPTVGPTATASPTPGAGTPTAVAPTPAKIWNTILTGDQLSAVNVTTDSLGAIEISFELKTEGAQKFATFTTNNVGKYLAIVLDKKILSAPTINSPITEGKGVIQGKYTRDEANNLAVQMRYGSLPVPLTVVESRVIGPTLGKDSLDKSLRAGLIGLLVVALFMIIYYRVPGVVAMLSIIFYGSVALMIFNALPGFTLTLPGIAGFLLSTGSALDANILIFERMKEELRAGRQLGQAIELGWRRAWPSIRDSNLATLFTCVILFIFGSSFGASIVKGFAVTLAVGVAVSLFCALFVTRTFLNLTVLFIDRPQERLNWFGI